MQDKAKNPFSQAIDEAILQSISDGLTVVDKAGNITYVNQAFEKLLGWKASDVIGKPLVKVVPREDEVGNPVPFKERILSTVLSGKTTPTTTTPTTTYFFKRRDKSRFPVALLVTPVNLQGKLIGAVETFRDITKERKVQKAQTIQLLNEVELEVSEREFVSVASHQLLTPLALIEGYISMLLSGKVGKADETAKKYLEEALNGANRMGKLIKRLLTVARLENRSVQVTKEVFDLSKLLSAVIEDFKLKIEKKDLKIDFKNPTPIKVSADTDYTREVVVNLLDNAIKYTDKGSITIIVSSKDGKGLVEFTDTGIGIDKEALSHIFEKFFMSANWISKQNESHGLGLYISRLLLAMMDGTIRVESEVGKGSTFTINLPLA